MFLSFVTPCESTVLRVCFLLFPWKSKSDHVNCKHHISRGLSCNVSIDSFPFSLALLGLVIGAFAWLIFRIIFAEYFESFFIPRDNLRVMPDKNFQNFAEFTLWPLIQTVFWYVLAPLCWVIAYFKLKEREV